MTYGGYHATARGGVAAALLLLAASPVAAQDPANYRARVQKALSFETAAGTVRTGAEIAYGLLSADDGGDRVTSIVNDDAAGSTFIIAADSVWFGGRDWRAGGLLEHDLRTLGSADATRDDTRPRDIDLELTEASLYIRYRWLGTITGGRTGGAADGAVETDLSETEAAASIIIGDVGGGYQIRSQDPGAGLTDLAWGDAFDPLEENGDQWYRFETRSFEGLTAKVATGRKRDWGAGLSYETEFERYSLASNFGYARDTGRLEIDAVPSNSFMGSVSILHQPTGVSLTVAGARRTFDGLVEFNDNSVGEPDSRRYGYLKLGLRRPWFDFGTTALFVEYAFASGMIGRETDAQTVASFYGADEDAICDGSAAPCTVTGSNSRAWGIGVVQQFEHFGASGFVAYRHRDLDVRLEDEERARVRAPAFKSLGTLFVGFSLEF